MSSLFRTCDQLRLRKFEDPSYGRKRGTACLRTYRALLSEFIAAQGLSMPRGRIGKVPCARRLAADQNYFLDFLEALLRRLRLAFLEDQMVSKSIALKKSNRLYFKDRFK